MTRMEFFTLVMRAALSTMPQITMLRLMLAMVSEADGWIRSDRSITLRSIFSMDTGKEGPIEDGDGIVWTPDLEDIVREKVSSVEDVGSEGKLAEETESAGGGGEVMGLDEDVGE